MRSLQSICVVALVVCLATGTSTLPRAPRSLEDVPYLPPEPYLPPASHNLIPLDSKDYLPPEETPLRIAVSNGDSEATAEAIGDNVEVHAVISETEESSSAPFKAEEPEGYFYPRPLQGFNLPDEELESTERPNGNEEGTEISPEIEKSNDRDTRSPQTSLLRTNPEAGPVRISTQPFQLSRVHEERNLKVRRSDEKKTKPFPNKGHLTAQTLPAVGVSNKSRRDVENVPLEDPERSSAKFRRQVNRRQTKPAPSRGRLTAQTLPARAPPKVFPQ